MSRGSASDSNLSGTNRSTGGGLRESADGVEGGLPRSGKAKSQRYIRLQSLLLPLVMRTRVLELYFRSFTASGPKARSEKIAIAHARGALVRLILEWSRSLYGEEYRSCPDKAYRHAIDACLCHIRWIRSSSDGALMSYLLANTSATLAAEIIKSCAPELACMLSSNSTDVPNASPFMLQAAELLAPGLGMEGLSVLRNCDGR